MTLTSIKLRELAEETAQRRLVTEAMKAQQGASQGQPSRLSTLPTLVSQLLHKLSLPVWEAVVKHS
jgi:hypothetical protein